MVNTINHLRMLRKCFLCITFIAVVVMISAILPVHATGGMAPAATLPQAEQQPYRRGEILLKLASGCAWEAEDTSTDTPRAKGCTTLSPAELSRFNRLLRGLGASRIEPLWEGGNTYRMALPTAADVPAAAASLATSPVVAFAEPNYLRRALLFPNDPGLESQWALHNIDAFAAWDITTGGEITVAVLDTGVSPSHPDLEGKVLPGYNAIQDNDASHDNNGHGTAVAGLLAARANNERGIAGLCWGCRILPVKVLDQYGFGEDAQLARGMHYAVEHGATIINMSLGGAENSQVLREAVESASSQNVLLVASAGNNHEEGNTTNYPAAYPQVLAVGASGTTDQVTGFSTTGSHIDLVAPGVGLWTTTLDGGYGTPNGTSFASPFVSGVAALVWTIRPDVSSNDVACMLRASADDGGMPGKDSDYGWGRLNARAALELAQSYITCPLDHPPATGNVPPAMPLADIARAFEPLPPVPTTDEQVFFPQTGHTLRGAFLSYWREQRGVAFFGLPISEEFITSGADGKSHVVQYFERARFEFHPDQPSPFYVQLSRLGDEVLQAQGRNWFTFERSSALPGCLFFEETGHTLCEPFLGYWRANGLELDGQPGFNFEESLSLLGQPISQPQLEEVAPGVQVTTQWFERARLELHGEPGSGSVLAGLLGRDLARARGWYERDLHTQ